MADNKVYKRGKFEWGLALFLLIVSLIPTIFDLASSLFAAEGYIGIFGAIFSCYLAFWTLSEIEIIEKCVILKSTLKTRRIDFEEIQSIVLRNQNSSRVTITRCDLRLNEGNKISLGFLIGPQIYSFIKTLTSEIPKLKVEDIRKYGANKWEKTIEDGSYNKKMTE